MLVLSSPVWASSVDDIKEGNLLYKQGQFKPAANYYEKALAAKDRQSLIAGYNLGNALYKIALQQENDDLKQAIAGMTQAVADYDRVIKNDPKNTDAIFNHDIAQKQLERLKKKQQEQQQQKQDQQQNKQEQNKQDQKDQQQQNKPSNQDKQQKQDQQQDQQKNQQQDQQQNQPQDQKKDQQQNKGQQPQGQPQDQDKQQEGQEPQAADQPQNTEQQQAQFLLEDYERNEQPKKLLNFATKSSDEQPVLKDW